MARIYQEGQDVPNRTLTTIHFIEERAYQGIGNRRLRHFGEKKPSK
jgi:hypothetical protein